MNYYRFNESALLDHLKSGTRESLCMFKTSFVESVQDSLPLSEALLRAM